MNEPVTTCMNITKSREVENVELIEKEGRDLGAMITMLTEATKELNKEITELQVELCKYNRDYTWC